jgi:hypothetical protein
MNVIACSFGFRPQHLSLRFTVIVLAVLSILLMMNGPPATDGPLTQDLVNAVGEAVSDAGISELNSDCHSGTAWRRSP